MRNRNLALAAMLAMTAMGGGIPAMTAATPMHKRPTREEEERAARARCDRQDALNAAEEKRKRKNAKRLVDAKKVGSGRTAPNVEFSGVPAGHSSNHLAGGTSAATQG